MKLAVVAASGRVGSKVVAEAAVRAVFMLTSNTRRNFIKRPNSRKNISQQHRHKQRNVRSFANATTLNGRS